MADRSSKRERGAGRPGARPSKQPGAKAPAKQPDAAAPKTPAKQPDTTPPKTPTKQPDTTPPKTPAKQPDTTPPKTPTKQPAERPGKAPDVPTPTRPPDKIPDTGTPTPTPPPDKIPDIPGFPVPMFDHLDTAVPLALLPVRLEAKYGGNRLRIRIYPDVIHADAHDERLTAREQRAGHAYWRTVWDTTTDTDLSAARRRLAELTGSHRAVWVAAATEPVNLADDDPEPEFPEIELVDTPGPTIARLLPDRFIIRIYDDEFELVHSEVGEPIPDDLPMAPSLGVADPSAKPAAGTSDHVMAFLGDQELAWTVDFEEALKVGMAVEIDMAVVPFPVGAVLALGARAGRDDLDESTALVDLMEAHRYTRGLGFVPSGTPTNNSDAGRSGLSVTDPDIDELFELEAHDRPLAPLGRGVLVKADAAMLYRIPSADAASLLMGVVRQNAFDKAELAEHAEGPVAWAMNLATGFATFGYYLSEILTTWMGDQVITDPVADIQDFYVRWVRGGGPLPVVRCGEQPYGLLPITDAPKEFFGWSPDFAVKLEHYLSQLLIDWLASLPVPTLDPDATDGRPGTSPAESALDVAEVLGAVPHPTGFELRDGTVHLDDDSLVFTEIMDDLNAIGDGDSANIPNDDFDPPVFFSRIWRARKPWIDGVPNDEEPDARASDIHLQQSHVDLLEVELDHFAFGSIRDAMQEIIDERLRPLLDIYEEGNLAVPSVWHEISESGGISAKPPAVERIASVLRLVGTTFDDHTRAVHDLVGRDGDLSDLIDALTVAIGELRGGVPIAQRSDLVTGDAPLLVHLIDLTHHRVPLSEAPRMALAFEGLKFIAGRDDGEARLALHMRESLGLAMYRLDAWITAIAAERLAQKRQATTTGLQIGAYGWLLDLRPSPGRVSQGYIHAHSLQDATTAAVLRSGWSAYGTESGEWPLSIDVSSARTRGGQWILDGVRSGQDLPEVLGSRFERYLHDSPLGLDSFIDNLRGIVVDATGEGRVEHVIDGLTLARAFSDMEITPTEEDVHAAVMGATQPAGSQQTRARRRAVRDLCDRLAGDLDAVADLLMVQTVDSLVRGSPDAAGAALSATGSGTGTIPPITATSTHREAQVVTHRVLDVFGVPDDVPPANPSPLATAEPRLTGWLTDRLPDPADVGAVVVVTAADGQVVERRPIGLDALGLTAVEAARLVARTVDQSSSRAARMIVAADRDAHESPDDDPDDDMEGAVTSLVTADGGDRRLNLDEFGLVARAALDAVGAARPLAWTDLIGPGAGSDEGEAPPEVEPDQRELEARRDRLADALSGLQRDLGAFDADGMVALRRAATINIPGALAAIESRGEDDVKSVDTAVTDRLDAAVAAARDGVDALGQIDLLIADALPVLPAFTPPLDADRARSLAHRARRADVEREGDAWWRQVTRVRTSLAAADDFRRLGEAVANAPVDPPELIQLPFNDDPWAAVALPESDRGARLCLFVLSGAELLAAGGRIAGLVSDSWPEGIPRPDHQTGIAFHFDSPTARPPQSILMSVTDEDAYSADLVADQLLHTIELAKIRAVGPDRLSGLGHYLPATYLRDGTVISRTETT